MKQLNEVARMQQLAGIINEIKIDNPGRPKLSKINPADVEDDECEIEIDGQIIGATLDENDNGEYTLSMQDSEYPKGVSIYDNFELIRKKIKNKYIFFDDNEWMHVSLEAFDVVDNINEIKINKPVILEKGNFYDFKQKTYNSTPEGIIDVQNPRDQNKFAIENGVLWYNGHKFLGKSNDNDLYFFENPSYRPDRYYIDKEKMEKLLLNGDIRKGKKPLDEIKINDPLPQNIFWKSLGDGFTIEDEYYHTPYGFIFDYNKDKEEFSSYIEYNDFGDDRDSGEEVIDPLLEEFENLLMKKHEELGIGYNIMTTSSYYYMTIQI